MSGTQEKELKHYQRLADISLRTLATVLAIIFAYVFSSGKIEIIGKVFVIAVILIILLGVIFSCFALYGQALEVRIVKWSAIISNLLMIIAICLMFILLMWILLT